MKSLGPGTGTSCSGDSSIMCRAPLLFLEKCQWRVLAVFSPHCLVMGALFCGRDCLGRDRALLRASAEHKLALAALKP